MADTVARIVAGTGLLLSVLSLIISYSVYRKNRSKLKAIYLFINPIEDPGHPGMHLIEITVSNLGQRPDSIISGGVDITQKNSLAAIVIPITGANHIETRFPLVSETRFPLVFEEKVPKKIKFLFPKEDVLNIRKISLTTGAKKEITVNPKWVREQIEDFF